jgi:soluble lytic murein transglycosylase-like protein
LKKYKFPGISVSLPHFSQSHWEVAAIALVLFAAAIGVFFIRKNFLRQLIQARKSWNLVFIYCFVALCIPFINATHSFEYWILCAVPLSAFIAAAFLYPNKNWFPAILHWLMVVFVIAFSYFTR